MFETIAFYSHDKEVFCSDDTIDLVVSFQTKEVSFFKNGEHKVSHQLPGFPTYNPVEHNKYIPLRIITSLCGNGQTISIVKPSYVLCTP